MRRRYFLGFFLTSLGLTLVSRTKNSMAVTPIYLNKTKEQWLTIVNPRQYAILFEEDTEPPGSSPLNKEYKEGTYICAACNNPLFYSQQKFDSGTGWPSFFDTIPMAINKKTDFKHIFPRTEYHCAHCAGHQGHVFNDGPKPTGLRYCNNGLALSFVPKDKPLPPVRT